MEIFNSMLIMSEIRYLTNLFCSCNDSLFPRIWLIGSLAVDRFWSESDPLKWTCANLGVQDKLPWWFNLEFKTKLDPASWYRTGLWSRLQNVLMSKRKKTSSIKVYLICKGSEMCNDPLFTEKNHLECQFGRGGCFDYYGSNGCN